MSKHTPAVEWQVAESDGEWLQLCGTAQPGDLALAAPVSPAARHLERRLAIVLVFLILLGAGAWTWQRQAAQASFAHDLQARVTQEVQAQPDGDAMPPQRAGLPMPAPVRVEKPLPAGGAAQVTIDGYEQIGDRVMAQVTVRATADGPAQAYRQTRFYRQSDGQWQPSAPDPALLGPQQTLRTAHFTFHSRALDAAAVAAAAPRLEQFYTQLRRDFGLAAGEAAQVIAVEVVTEPQPPAVHYMKRTYMLLVPSPALLALPLELTADEALYQSLVYPLASLLIWEVKWPRRAPTLPLRLDELPARVTDIAGAPGTSISAGQLVGMETVVEYVVATYGRAALPHLVTALGEHVSWQSLTPAIFGLSVEQFEAGWQAYLAVYQTK